MMPRFLIDRGTATVSAALVAPLDGRWRLLASAAFPASVELDAVLAYVADRAAGLLGDLPELAGQVADWRRRERIAATSQIPRRIALVAPTARRIEDLEAAATQAGWQVAGHLSSDRADALATSDALGDVELDAIAIAGTDPPRSDERAALADLASMAAAIVARRQQLLPILCGAAAEQADRFPIERVIFAPAPSADGTGDAGNELARLLMALGGETDNARLATARTVRTLAAVLDRTIE